MEMKYIITEEEAQYMERHKGHFSKKLAAWAISNMKNLDATEELRPINTYSLEEVEQMIQPFRNEIGEEAIYDAWYLANMVRADYLGSSITDKQHVALYVKDTICDPDGDATMVLACFRAKCDVKGVPIHWERFL